MSFLMCVTVGTGRFVCAELDTYVEVVKIVVIILAQEIRRFPNMTSAISSSRFHVHVTIVVSLPCAMRRRRSFRMSDAVGTSG